MIGTCPHCNRHLPSLNVNAVDAVDPASMSRAWKSATFTCPMCQKVLGAGFDQTVLAQVVATEVVNRLRQSLSA